MYHRVLRPPKFGQKRGLYVSPTLFRRQMRELRDAGYRTASLREALAPEPGRRIVLTFDDGFASAFHHALPVLRECGFTGIQFIVTDRTTNQWDGEWGRSDYPLMDDNQIREWLAAGQEIGSHTLTHPWLTRVSLAEARREIQESKARLEDRFQRRISHFCYPYGDLNPAVRELVIEAGYETACSIEPGSHRAGFDPFSLRRWLASHRRPVLAAWLPSSAF